MNNQNHLYVDAEFIATTDPVMIEEIASKVSHPGNIKLPASIEKWNEEKKPEAVKKALENSLFDAALGELISFSCALGEGEVLNAHRTDKISEKTMLEEVNSILSTLLLQKRGEYETARNIIWTGVNICECDLIYLWKRMVINNVRPCVPIPYQARPWSNEVCDLRAEWGSKDRSSMDFMLKATKLGGKGDFSGADVSGAWARGEYQRIADYNDLDITDTRNLHKRMFFIS